MARGASLIDYEIRAVPEDGRRPRPWDGIGASMDRLGGAHSILLAVLSVVALAFVLLAVVKVAGIPTAVALPALVPLGVAFRRYGSRFLLGILVVSALVLAQAGLFELFKDAVTHAVVVDAAGAVRDIVWRERVEHRLLQAGAVFAIVVALALIIYHWRHALIHTTIRRIRIPPKRILIMGLSDLRGEGPGRAQLRENVRSLRVARTLPLSLLAMSRDVPRPALSVDVLVKLSQLKRFPWQQNLRALKPHIGVLEHLIVITSERSQSHFPAFEKFVKGMAHETGPLRVHALPSPTDFEDYDDLAGAFGSALGIAREVCQAKLGDVCIDATAGQKIFSIAAAIVTLNKNLVFTYVNNRGKVRAFDANVATGEFS